MEEQDVREAEVCESTLAKAYMESHHQGKKTFQVSTKT